MGCTRFCLICHWILFRRLAYIIHRCDLLFRCFVLEPLCPFHPLSPLTSVFLGLPHFSRQHHLKSKTARLTTAEMGGWWCDKCERSFVHEAALDQHLRDAYMHNYCFVCQRDFSSHQALAQHKQNSYRHNICGGCGNDFVRADDLDDHIEECHWYCSRCTIFVDSEDMLEAHYCQSSAHNYCGPCKREFVGASQLNSVSRPMLGFCQAHTKIYTQVE